MNNLEKILNKLMRVEDDINALYVVLEALEKYYETSGIEELNAIICLVKGQMENFSNRLGNGITELDKYLLDN